jgi:hypothetical protein
LLDGAQPGRIIIVVVFVIVDALRLDHVGLHGVVVVPRQHDRLGLGLAFCILVVVVSMLRRKGGSVGWRAWRRRTVGAGVVKGLWCRGCV